MQRVASDVFLYVSHRAQYAGRAGVVGLALLVFAAAFFVTTNSALRGQSAELRADLAAAQQQAVARRASGPDISPAARLQVLVHKLPERSQLPAITERIVAQAAGAGLLLERGNYDLAVTRSGEIVRARMSFPVQGAYPSIRKFVDGTLTALPNAAVDGLRLERDSVGANQIEADIRFAVFLRNGP
jgi:Tfp pilus assembly protein PilO